MIFGVTPRWFIMNSLPFIQNLGSLLLNLALLSTRLPHMNEPVTRLRFFHSLQGFTLVELMVAVVIGAILLAVAIPGFSNLVKDNHLAAAVNAMTGSIHLARMEAVRKNMHVVLCPSANGSNCSASGGWGQGWIVFSDADRNKNFNDDGDSSPCENGEDCLLRSHDAIGGNITVSSTLGNNIRFFASGMADSSTTGKIKFCDDRKEGRELELIASGRLRLKKDVSCP